MASLSKTDRIIVRELQRDGQTTLEQLGQLIGKSSSTVKRDVDALNKAKVILGYKAVIDRKELGFGMLAMTLIELKSKGLRELDRFADQLEGMPNIIECARVAGDFDFHVKTATRDMDHHYEVARQIAELEGIARVMTFIVVKEHRTKDLPIE